MTKTIFVAVAVAALQAAAQERPEFANRPNIRATGDAVVQAKPDLARIDFGVTSQAATAQAAAAQNAKQLDAVLAALRKALGPAADIKTVNYSLNPDYRYPREGGKPEIVGYSAANTVRTATTDLDTVGKLIDAVTAAGATNVQRLQFTLRDEQAVRQQALAEAARKARANAQALAAALDVKIVRILSVQAGGGGVIPLEREMLAARAADFKAAAAPTPIEAGTLEVRANVTLAVEIAQ
jgi:uncharacterized protein YggE